MPAPIAFRKDNPTAGDVHVDRPLTTLSVGWIQDQTRYVADRVFPQVPVPKKSDLFFVFDRGDWLRATAEKRAPSTESAGGGYKLSTQSYVADVWAFHKDVDDQVRGNADSPLTPDRSAVNFSTQACMTRKELEWNTNYFTAGVWTNDQTGVAAAPGANEFIQWDVTASTPIVDIRAQIQAISRTTGFKPNKLVLGADVWLILEDHPDFIDRLNRGQTPVGPAMVNLAVLATVLGLEEVMVSEAVINTAVEGATDSIDFVMGKSALLVHAASAPAIDTPSAGYTFTWTGLFGAGAGGTRISRIRADLLKSDRIECEMAWDQNVVAADLGRFFATAVG